VNRTPEFWSGIMPAAIAGGSTANARNVIEMMRQDIAELAAALKPFAAITPSSIFAEDGSEAEKYGITLASASNFDFTGGDLARARAVLSGKGIKRD